MNSINFPADGERTREQLSEFGKVLALAFVFLSLVPLYYHRWTALVFIGLSAYFLLSAIFLPQTLARIERLWMKFGERLSCIMTFVILSLIYYVVITPLAVLLRVMGKDLLTLKIEPHCKSYWRDIPADGPGSRYDKPF